MNLYNTILVFLIIIVPISGCTFVTDEGKKIVTFSLDFEKNCEKKEGGNRETCYISNAIDKLDITLCENVGSPQDGYYNRYICYTNVILKVEDFTLCNQTSDPEGCFEYLTEVKKQL